MRQKLCQYQSLSAISLYHRMQGLPQRIHIVEVIFHKLWQNGEKALAHLKKLTTEHYVQVIYSNSKAKASAKAASVLHRHQFDLRTTSTQYLIHKSGIILLEY